MLRIVGTSNRYWPNRLYQRSQLHSNHPHCTLIQRGSFHHQSPESPPLSIASHWRRTTRVELHLFIPSNGQPPRQTPRTRHLQQRRQQPCGGNRNQSCDSSRNALIYWTNFYDSIFKCRKRKANQKSTCLQSESGPRKPPRTMPPKTR